jgi:hypothetical protein
VRCLVKFFANLLQLPVKIFSFALFFLADQIWVTVSFLLQWWACFSFWHRLCRALGARADFLFLCMSTRPVFDLPRFGLCWFLPFAQFSVCRLCFSARSHLLRAVVFALAPSSPAHALICSWSGARLSRDSFLSPIWSCAGFHRVCAFSLLSSFSCYWLPICRTEHQAWCPFLVSVSVFHPCAPIFTAGFTGPPRRNQFLSTGFVSVFTVRLLCASALFFPLTV